MAMSKGPAESRNDLGGFIGLLGGAVGAAGWIFGMAFGLVRQAAKVQPRPVGIDDDISVVFSCAVAVLLAGIVLSIVSLSDLRLGLVFQVEVLLGASLVFGTFALVWMDVHGVLSLAVLGNADDGQPGSEIWVFVTRHLPTRLAYAAPACLLALMVAAWYRRPRRWFPT